MSLRLILMILISVMLSVIAQLLLKAGAASANLRPQSLGSELQGLAQSPLVYAGLAFYGLGALVWLFVLGRAPLSLAYPFVGLGFVMVMIAGATLFGEHVGPARIAGTLLIASGCVLVARSV